MPRYLTSHNMACLTRQGARQLAEQMRAGAEVEFLRLLANMTDGHLIGEFQAPSKEALLAWMETLRIHHEWIHRIDLEVTRDEVRDL